MIHCLWDVYLIFVSEDLANSMDSTAIKFVGQFTIQLYSGVEGREPSAWNVFLFHERIIHRAFGELARIADAMQDSIVWEMAWWNVYMAIWWKEWMNYKRLFADGVVDYPFLLPWRLCIPHSFRFICISTIPSPFLPFLIWHDLMHILELSWVRFLIILTLVSSSFQNTTTHMSTNFLSAHSSCLSLT